MLLVLHAVREPVLAVGLDQRVSAADLLAVQGDDDLAALRGSVGRDVVELLGFVCAGVPDDHLAAAILPFGDLAVEGQVFQRVVLGVHGQVVDRGGVRQVLGYRPAHQHTVAFEPKVVMQASGMVFLDDEPVVVSGLGRCVGHRLRVFAGSRMLR